MEDFLSSVVTSRVVSERGRPGNTPGFPPRGAGRARVSLTEVQTSTHI